MKPSSKARYAAAVTLSKGKMFEFGVPDELHIEIPANLDLKLQYPLALGTIGDFAAEKVDEALGRRDRTTPIEEVLFAAQVLIATVDAKVAVSIEGLVRLIAAAAFFLADSPGRALAHCKDVSSSSLDKDDAFAQALLASLTKPWEIHQPHRLLPSPARGLMEEIRLHYAGHVDFKGVANKATALHTWVYANGDAHEFMVGDLLCAVAIQRASISAWTCLPRYTNLAVETWSGYLSRREAIKDLWPSQQMLGRSNVYAGASAIVQMPTSAGKTRATELILRSAFRSARTSLAIVVAPFRALCYEIAQDLRSKFRADGYHVNQLSDALQQDYRLDLSDFLILGIDTAPHVVVLTPEKLLFILRQETEFVSNVGLVIYDEGHQFDSSGRGVAYELLLTSIKRALPASAQTVLISAVISNADQLASWLLSEQPKVITDSSVQTSRHVAFATMVKGASGQLQFDSIIEGEQEFFVPRLISHHQLKGEKQPVKFPTNESGSIALYLGFKLVSQGGVAIFARAPDSASKIIRDAVEKVVPRAEDIVYPSVSANPKELAALVKLYAENFGVNSFLTVGARYGLFAHTGETPQGIRLAIEHAMRESLLSLVVCTTTLAQGVNLPIRYLLITTPHQGRKRITTRDFQNLVGRAGRAGMYGDGTVIFTDSKLFDARNQKRREWGEIQALLRPENSSPTSSTLLRVVQPLYNRFKTYYLSGISPVQVVEGLLEEEDNIYRLALGQVVNTEPKHYFSQDDVREQLREKARTISSVQTFLMSNQESFDSDSANDRVLQLARETFAYHMGKADEKVLLEWVFQRIWQGIARKNLEPEVQARYGKGLLGLKISQEIDVWVSERLFQLQLSESAKEILDEVWRFIDASPLTEKLRRLEPEVARESLVEKWVEGRSFKEIQEAIESVGGYIRWGSQRRKVKIDPIVGFCQNQISFQACLLLSAMAASYEDLSREASGDGVGYFERLSKMMKYGLPSDEAIAVYEAGFAERVLSQKIAQILPEGTVSQNKIRMQLRIKENEIRQLLEGYPAYFRVVLDSILR